MGSGTTSSLSNYQMDDEMKGFYKQENIDPVRSSMASQSISASMASQNFAPGVRPYQPQHRVPVNNYQSVYASVPNQNQFPSQEHQQPIAQPQKPVGLIASGGFPG
jgi:hypothetical protein